MGDVLANPFPGPPSQYKLYTKRNLTLLNLIRSRSSTSLHEHVPLNEQQQILVDQGEIPHWDITHLEPPRIDWIVEEGGYESFGEAWPLPEVQSTLDADGIMQLYPPVSDHRPALRKLLRTILVTYNQLLGSLLEPPVTDGSEVHGSHQHLDWLRLNAINMIAAINELRPAQARATLEAAMLKQLSSRNDETRSIHAKCDALEEQLVSLQRNAKESATRSLTVTSPSVSLWPELELHSTWEQVVSDHELLRWAEEVSMDT